MAGEMALRKACPERNCIYWVICLVRGVLPFNFLAGGAWGSAISPDFPCQEIEGYRPELVFGQSSPPWVVPAAEQSIDARQQFWWVEGLGQVVVGAQPQAENSVLDIRAAGHHQNGHPDTAGAHLTANVEAAVARQQHIQKNQIERLTGKPGNRLARVGGAERGKTFATKQVTKNQNQASVVINY